MDRRDFLRTSGLVSLGGIVAGPSILEQFARLTWKRTLWGGAVFNPNPISYTLSSHTLSSHTAAAAWRKFQRPAREALRFSVEEIGRTRTMSRTESLPLIREVLAPVLMDKPRSLLW